MFDLFQTLLLLVSEVVDGGPYLCHFLPGLKLRDCGREHLFFDRPFGCGHSGMIGSALEVRFALMLVFLGLLIQFENTGILFEFLLRCGDLFMYFSGQSTLYFSAVLDCFGGIAVGNVVQSGLGPVWRVSGVQIVLRFVMLQSLF